MRPVPRITVARQWVRVPRETEVGGASAYPLATAAGVGLPPAAADKSFYRRQDSSNASDKHSPPFATRGKQDDTDTPGFPEIYPCPFVVPSDLNFHVGEGDGEAGDNRREIRVLLCEDLS